jgi:hypothetical protein
LVGADGLDHGFGYALPLVVHGRNLVEDELLAGPPGLGAGAALQLLLMLFPGQGDRSDLNHIYKMRPQWFMRQNLSHGRTSARARFSTTGASAG